MYYINIFDILYIFFIIERLVVIRALIFISRLRDSL